MNVTGRWLDPEPPHSEHTEVECRGDLPKPRSQDVGRRWECGTCGRTYRVGDDQRDGLGWSKVEPMNVTGIVPR